MKAEQNNSGIERSWQQGVTHSRQQELGKEQRLWAEREQLKRTVRPEEGNRTSPMAGIRSCTYLPQGARGGIQRTARDRSDLHIEERVQEGKSAISLEGVARNAMKAASAGALSLL